MSEALLDSNIVIDVLNGVGAARQAVEEFKPSSISTMTWIEVMAGVQDPEEERQVRTFLDSFTTLPLSHAVAERTVRIRRERRLKLPDAVIWATALTHDMVLVTRNTKDFPLEDPGIRIPYRV